MSLTQTTHPPAGASEEEQLRFALAHCERAISIAGLQLQLEEACAQTTRNALARAYRIRAGIVAMLNPVDRFEAVTVGDLRLGDVVRWPGEHGGLERVATLGRPGDELVKVGTTDDLVDGAGLVVEVWVPQYAPVDVRTPRPVEDLDDMREVL